MNTQRSRILSEYRTPMAYMTPEYIRKRRIIHFIIAATITCVGIVIIYTVFTSAHADVGRIRHGLAGIMIFAIPPYGIFKMLTLDRSITNRRRRQLVFKDPYIKRLNRSSK